MPIPVSAIISTTESLTMRLRTMTRPPSGVNLTALDSRLTRICLMARRSASSGTESCTSAFSVSRFSLARPETTRSDS